MRLKILWGLCALLALLLGAVPAAAQLSVTPAVTTNGSVAIASGNTFQTVLPPGTRRSLTVQNNNTNTDNCWVFVGNGAATAAKAILLAPGQAYTRFFPYIPNDSIQVTCATTSDTIYVDTQ